jgi:hypothetical protein
MNESEINDCRTANDFKNKTFSKYGRSKVKNELLTSLYNNKIEPACYWSVELICAGHYHDLWDILLLYMSRHIYLGNPKLPIYMEMRFHNFKTIIQNGYIDNELSLRNNDKIRKLFAELICILSNSRKKHAFESLAIKDINDFDVINLSRKLKAPNIQYAEEIFKKGDPKELFIAINEFAYHISNISKDITLACYWIEWIIQFENISKQKKIKCNCERRAFAPVNEKYQMEVIWMVWDGLIKEAKKKNIPLYNKIIKALLNLYCIRYSPSANKKRRYIIYCAISFLTEDINFDIPLVENKNFIETITNKINIIYKEVKKNEQSPKTDYLFTGVQKTNTEKTVEKLEKMNSILDKKGLRP